MRTMVHFLFSCNIQGGISFSTNSDIRGVLELEDGTEFQGELFGHIGESDGEVVFNTGMVGYVESLTDPSYRGQILTFTYPLIGNYGVPSREEGRFESDHVQVRGVVVTENVREYSHWSSTKSLDDWLKEEGIVGISGIDTRELTKHLREKGTMLGRIKPLNGKKEAFKVENPNKLDLVAEVSTRTEIEAASEKNENCPTIAVVDCGCKKSIVLSLLKRGCHVVSIPHDSKLADLKCDGILISNGPGDPGLCRSTIAHVRELMDTNKKMPVAGICLGTQIMALAAGASTYKLPFGHRSHNQPCIEVGTEHCVITSQNHGYAIDEGSLPNGWEVWYRNLNDRTVEGIKHKELPYLSVQFHPEASPGPTDPGGFFDLFLEVVRNGQ